MKKFVEVVIATAVSLAFAHAFLAACGPALAEEPDLSGKDMSTMDVPKSDVPDMGPTGMDMSRTDTPKVDMPSGCAVPGCDGEDDCEGGTDEQVACDDNMDIKQLTAVYAPPLATVTVEFYAPLTADSVAGGFDTLMCVFSNAETTESITIRAQTVGGEWRVDGSGTDLIDGEGCVFEGGTAVCTRSEDAAGFAFAFVGCSIDRSAGIGEHMTDFTERLAL